VPKVDGAHGDLAVQIVTALQAEFEAMPEARGALFFGSGQRGRLDPHSDLDIYVLIVGDRRWNEGRLVEGRPIELAFSPVHGMSQHLREHNPIVTNAFASGQILFDRSGEVAELAAEARRRWVAGPPPLTDADTLRWRFRLTDLLYDLLDLAPDVGAPADAAAVGALLVSRSIEAASAQHRRWPPPRKGLLETLRRDVPALAPLIERYYQSPSPKAAMAIGRTVLTDLGGIVVEYKTEPRRCSDG
jgi:hypothetical protein